MNRNKSAGAARSMILLGATGSIGELAVDVARQTNTHITALCAGQNAARVEELAREFGVSYCAMADETAARDLKGRLADTDICVLGGEEGICEMTRRAEGDMVLNSIVGGAGLKPTLAAIERGTPLALANKESLVVAGDIVMAAAKRAGVEILPVDSEHCAIHQCLRAGEAKEVKRILLTASGGPFFGKNREELSRVTLEDALAHPTWKMGSKITIDSATLMNKGFEVIEAAHLFSLTADQIGVVVHRESIIHSMVEYIDNSVIAQLSVPDMRFCVGYALNRAARPLAVIPPLDLTKVGKMTFAEADTDTFVLLTLALDALRAGGAMPAVLNASNEVAVAAFLQKKIPFLALFDLVGDVMDAMASARSLTSLEELLAADAETRALTAQRIAALASKRNG